MLVAGVAGEAAVGTAAEAALVAAVLVAAAPMAGSCPYQRTGGAHQHRSGRNGLLSSRKCSTMRPLSFTPTKHPNKKQLLQLTVPRGCPRRVERPAHRPEHTHREHHTRLLYNAASAGSTTAAKQAHALTFRAFAPWLGYNTHQHHRLDSSRECTVCTGRDRAPAVLPGCSSPPVCLDPR